MALLRSLVVIKMAIPVEIDGAFPDWQTPNEQSSIFYTHLESRNVPEHTRSNEINYGYINRLLTCSGVIIRSLIFAAIPKSWSVAKG